MSRGQSQRQGWCENLGAGSLVLCLCRIPLCDLLFLIFFLATALSKFILIAECCQELGSQTWGSRRPALPFIQLLWRYRQASLGPHKSAMEVAIVDLVLGATLEEDRLEAMAPEQLTREVGRATLCSHSCGLDHALENDHQLKVSPRDSSARPSSYRGTVSQSHARW